MKKGMLLSKGMLSSISVKLSVVTSILLIASLVTVGLLSYFLANKALNDSIQSNLLNRPVDVALSLGETVVKIKTELKSVAQNGDIQSMVWERQQYFLSLFAKEMGFEKIGIADLEGKVTFTDNVNMNIADNEFFKTAQNGETVLTDPFVDEASGTLQLAAISQIKMTSNVLGYVVALVSYDNVFGALANIKEGKTGYAFVLDKSGIKLVHPNQELVRNKDNDLENVKKDSKLQQLVDLEKKMVAGETGLGSYLYNNVEKFMSYAPVPNTDWSISIAVPKTEMLETVNQLRNTVLGLIVLFVVIGVAITAVISSSMVRKPVRKLVSYADQLALGDVNIDVKVTSKDEIGQLATSMKTMVNNIQTQAHAAQCIAAGDLNFDITAKSENDVLSNSIISIKASLQNLIEDANGLVEGALEGELSIRADETKHPGDYKKIIQGVNKTLDAVILPVQEASDVLEEMAKGNLHVSMQGDYKGDHAVIKNALNNTLAAISGYVDEIALVLAKIAEGDLDAAIQGNFLGEFIHIKEPVNHAIDTFNTVISDINAASDQVAAGTRQVSEGSQALSQGSSEQAAAVEEFTASITQIAAQTKQNAVNANQAKELAQLAQQNAQEGNMQMGTMLESMKQINEASRNINKIIKVIDDIAFQTNILALNAAVEAAHAGAHGKGFAVVADEVRNLAARSANAAKETTGLIEGSIKKIEDGTKIANQTADALDKIVENVEKAAVLVSEIAVASNEQATGIAQINKGIEQVSQVTQSNSATAVESAATSEQLASQAQMLKEMVLRFKIRNNTLNTTVLQEKKKVAEKNTKQTGKAQIILEDKEFGKYC